MTVRSQTRSRQRTERADSRRARRALRPAHVARDRYRSARAERLSAARRTWTTSGCRISRDRSRPTASFNRSSCARTDDGRYHIIAGERRWRAAQLAGLHKVPGRRQGRRRRRKEAPPRDGAHREHPAREPQSDRRSAGVSDDWSTSSACGRKTSPLRSARIDRRSPTPCGCCGCPTKCEPRSRRAACRWATHGRSWRSRTRPISAASRAMSLSRSSRCAKPKRSSRRRRVRTGGDARSCRRKVKDVHTRAAEEQLRLVTRHQRRDQAARQGRQRRDRVR